MIPSSREAQVEESSEAEGARSATGVTETGAASRPRLAERVADPEVPAQAQRRKFTAEYKLRIVREAERCKAARRDRRPTPGVVLRPDYPRIPGVDYFRRGLRSEELFFVQTKDGVRGLVQSFLSELEAAH